MRKFAWRFVVSALLISTLIYGGIRFWFRLTDGFRIIHITSNLEPDPRWETRALDPGEEVEVELALSQPYSYLGKGCQSYVFESEDKKYVLKFLKYKRYRPQFYYYWFTFLPGYQNYLDEKIASKKCQLERLFCSLTTAFDHLSEETAIIYLHLNKSAHLNKKVRIRDKVGREHQLEMDQMEFIIQKKGELLCPTIDRMMADGKEEETKTMLSGLFQMILREYRSGLADTDHALIQNTGVIEGKAFQLDTGRFVADPLASNPDFYHQEIFNKYYKFRLWLEKKHPSLLEHVNNELIEEMGEKFYAIQFIQTY